MAINSSSQSYSKKSTRGGGNFAPPATKIGLKAGHCKPRLEQHLLNFVNS